jgi:hypothetical protein
MDDNDEIEKLIEAMIERLSNILEGEENAGK